MNESIIYSFGMLKVMKILFRFDKSYELLKNMVSTFCTLWWLSECGGGFTSKLEGMFKDMELSKDIMLAFKQVSVSFSFLADFFFNADVFLNLGWPSLYIAHISFIESTKIESYCQWHLCALTCHLIHHSTFHTSCIYFQQ